MGRKEFHTVRGYELLQQGEALTPSMEDYLEMTCRLTRIKGYTRISDLANALHVQAPSASRMVQKLAELGYLDYERYGIIRLTVAGQQIRAYLLQRHQTVERFPLQSVTENVLEETEKVEHSISGQTLRCLQDLLAFLNRDNEWQQTLRRKKRLAD